MKRQKKKPLHMLRLTLAGTAAGVLFSGLCVRAGELFHLQLGPAIASCVAGFSVGALVIIVGMLLLTLLLGRVYCSVLCPLGILQDVIDGVTRRKNVALKNHARLRYGVAGVVFGMLFFGWSVGLLLLDPYSNFGRILWGFCAGGFVPFLVLVVLVLWKRRVFCVTLCPVGTLLGLFAKWSIFRLKLTEKCVKCKKCAAVCPVGAIDVASGKVDNERCVRCMACLSACKLEGIRFERAGSGRKAAETAAVEAPAVDASRRRFLVDGGILLAGLAAGAAVAKGGMTKLGAWVKRTKLLPPGAGDAERFAAKCTSCQLCVKCCPEKIIVPAKGGVGPVSLNLSNGVCRYDCNRCSQVCPTGAIMPLTLAVKQRTKIAEAKFNPQKCIVFQEEEACGRCAAACPVGAITLRKNGTPRPVNKKLCIGCGACVLACPALPEKAMSLSEIEKQEQL